MKEESQSLGPISLSERILFIDVLGGMSLFGILAANMRGFFAPMDAYMHIGMLYHSRVDVLAQAFIDIFIQGKFISIFSFLFGIGFAIQMSRAEARGARFMGFYPRRLLALALFGLIHGILIWAGGHPAHVCVGRWNFAAAPRPLAEDSAAMGRRIAGIPDCGQHDFCGLVFRPPAPGVDGTEADRPREILQGD